MSGRSDIEAALRAVLWTDAELNGITVDYSDFSLLIRQGDDSLKRVVCEGYLGFELTGFWDEVVISKAEILESGSLLDRCAASLESRLGAKPLPSGSEERNRAVAVIFAVTFGDGCQLNVVMKGLRVEDAA